MKISTTTWIIIAAAAVGLYAITRPASTTILGTKSTSTSGKWYEQLGAGLGAGFKSWFGTGGSDDNGYVPDITYGDPGVAS